MADTPDDAAADGDVADGEAPAAGSELDDARMSFVEHLRELRTRIRNSVIWLIGGFSIAYTFKQEILVWLLAPLLDVWEKHAIDTPSIGEPKLYFGSLIDPFWAYFGLALWAGIFIASPFIFHQLWKFIAPGLYKRERSLGIVFAATSALFFIGGAAFCYYFVLPAVYDFLLGYSTANLSDVKHDLGIEYSLDREVGLSPLLTIGEYISFARRLLIGFGLVFELPLIIFFLSIIGMVTHRGLWKFNRWWVVISFVMSAMLTPPDVVSQIMMAGPLIVLYNISIVISLIVTKRREARDRAIDRADE